MSYIDIFVAPVPRKKYAAYKEDAELSAKVWLDHGALSYFEVEAAALTRCL